jgi:hypothetical protein
MLVGTNNQGRIEITGRRNFSVHFSSLANMREFCGLFWHLSIVVGLVSDSICLWEALRLCRTDGLSQRAVLLLRGQLWPENVPWTQAGQKLSAFEMTMTCRAANFTLHFNSAIADVVGVQFIVLFATSQGEVTTENMGTASSSS